MDFVTEIISYLGDLEKYIESYIEIAINHSFIAVILGIPIIAIFLYTFIERALNFIAQFRVNHRRNKIILITILSISTFLSIIFVDNIVKAQTIRPVFLDRDGNQISLDNNQIEPITVFGDVLKLKWKYDLEDQLRKESQQKSKKFRYALEYSKDKKFKKPYVENESRFVKYNFAEIKGAFNQAVYWRVTPGYLTNNEKIPFKRLKLPSHPVNVLHYASVLSRIKKEKNIKVCTSRTTERSFLSYIPRKNLELPTTADPVGLEPELINLIANNIISNLLQNSESITEQSDDKLWILRDVEWSKIFEDTSQAKCDIAISSISITDDRKKEYDLRFSKPYLKTYLALIANHISLEDEKIVDLLKTLKSKELKIVELLKGKEVGVLLNSTSLETIEEFNNILKDKNDSSPEKLFIKPKTFSTVSDALNDLDSTNPTVDFVLADKVYTEYYLFNKKGLKMVYELSPDMYPDDFPEKLIGENYGIAVNYKASEILEEIDKTINNLNKTQRLENMINKHKQKHKKIQECISNDIQTSGTIDGTDCEKY